MRQGAGLACIDAGRACAVVAALLLAAILTAVPMNSSFPGARPAFGATEDAKSKPPEKAKNGEKQKAKSDDKDKGKDTAKEKDKGEKGDKDEEKAEPEKSKGPLTLTIPLSGDDPPLDDSLAGGVTVTSADKPAPGGTLQQPGGAASQADRNPFQLLDRQDSLSLIEGPEVQDEAAAKPPAAKPPGATKKAQPAAKQPKPAAATKPAAKAAAKPAAKPATKTAPAKSAAAPAAETADVAPPEVEPAAAPQDSKTLSEYFTEEELATPQSDSVVRIEDETAIDTAAAPTDPAAQDELPPAGVIRTTGSDSTGGFAHPALSKVLSGEAQDTRLGAGLTGISPWRSAGMVLLCLALAFAAMWAAGRLRSPLRALRQHSLAVIETISIGAGRQIIIIEMNEDALVLGVTPHSINLLDKVPLEQMNSSYSGTVNAIIQREQASLPSEWENRPAFSKGPQLPAPPPAPPLPNRSYSHKGNAYSSGYGSGISNGYNQRHVSVGELRRARAMAQPVAAGNLRPPARTLPPYISPEDRTKADLIGRIREQLSQLEK